MHCNCSLLNCCLIGSFLPLVYFSCIIKFQLAFRNSFRIPSRQLFQSEAVCLFISWSPRKEHWGNWEHHWKLHASCYNNDSKSIWYPSPSLPVTSTLTSSNSFSQFLKAGAIIPIHQKRHLRIKEVKYLSQSQKAVWGLTPMSPKSCAHPTVTSCLYTKPSGRPIPNEPHQLLYILLKNYFSFLSMKSFNRENGS